MLETVVPDGDALWLLGRTQVYRRAGGTLARVGGDFADLSAGAAAVTKDGALVVADGASVVQVSADGKAKTLADGLKSPFGLAVDDRSIVVVEKGAHAVRRIVAGKLEPLAGSGRAGREDGPCAEAEFTYPSGAAVGPDGAIYVKDGGRDEGSGASVRVRRIAGGKVTTVAKILP